jgi:cysteine desulfurase
MISFTIPIEADVNPIYLDYNATTLIDPQVRTAMLPYFEEQFGNPSSTHSYGKVAHRAIDKAREQVASLIGALASEIVFTGGGTEASNQVIKGVMLRGDWRDAEIVISSIEHPATYNPAYFVQALGCRVTVVTVDSRGLIDPDDVRRAITAKTRLISVMHSNNEIGTLEPIREIAAIARERGVLVHADAAQSLGKLIVDVRELGVDFLTMAGHKVYAPKGIGALYVRSGIDLPSFVHGAGQEGGRRAGTENVPSIVALGKAAELAELSLPAAAERLKSLRDRLETRLRERLGNRFVVNGHPEKRLPNTLNASFLGRIGSELLEEVPEIAASTGAACHEGHFIVSPIFTSLGLCEEVGRGAIRLTVGRFTTEDEIDRAADLLAQAASE